MVKRKNPENCCQGVDAGPRLLSRQTACGAQKRGEDNLERATWDEYPRAQVTRSNYLDRMVPKGSISLWTVAVITSSLLNLI